MSQGRDRRKPEFPPPFDFVPFADHRELGTPPGHDAFHHLSGLLEYNLRVLGLLHVSSGTYALAMDAGMTGTGVLRDHFRVTVDGERRVAVPGSTMKGAVRSIVEAVTSSCVVVVKRDMREGVPNTLKACKPPKLCPACTLFGAMSHLGRVRFGDVVLTEGRTAVYDLPQLFRPRPIDDRGRDFTKRYLRPDGKLKGRKFYYHGKIQPRHAVGAPIEVITPNSILSGWVAFESLSEAELGLLLFGLGLDNSFRLMLGAGKPMALGKVRSMAKKLTLYQEASLLNAELADERLEGEAMTARLQHAIVAAEPLLLAEQVDELRRILDPNNPRVAPTGVY